MRLPSLMALLPMLAAMLGCDGVGGDELTSSRQLRRNVSVTSGDGAHDSADTVGEHDQDVTNPNASARPPAPTTAGISSGQFALALGTNTPVVGLGDSTEIDVTVQPKNGFAGQVQVSVTGLPEGASAAPITVSPGAPGKLVITTEVTAVATPANTSTPLVVTARSGTAEATANANFKIAPKLTLTVPINIDALRAAGQVFRDQWGTAFGSNPQPLQTQVGNGVVVTVFNADSKAHIIHGQNGFAHGDTSQPIQPNAFEMTNGTIRTRTLNVGTNANGYPHEGTNGAGASFQISVQQAN